MDKLKVAYFGSPIFSAHLLEQLIQDKEVPIEVALVVTQPDKPIGKKHTITPSPVKLIAEKFQIPCWDKKLKEGSLIELLRSVDLALVYAYGFKELIPLDYLKAPKMHFDVGENKTSGFINIHPSLLPKYRGSSPIAYPLLLGEDITGVSLFVMDELMDHGPIISQEKIVINNKTRPEMEQILTNLGFRMIKKLLTQFADNPNIILSPQDHANATRAPYMTKDDGFVAFSTIQKALKNEPVTLQELPNILQIYIEKYDFVIGDGGGKASDSAQHSEHWRKGNVRQNLLQNPSEILVNFWRGMLPWPGVWTKVVIDGQEKRLKLNNMNYVNDKLTLTTVQLEGKKPVDFETFQRAYGLL